MQRGSSNVSESIKPYLELKRAMLANGLLSCSQAGFNIAMGPLTELRRGLSALFARVFRAAEHWEVPVLLREDWIPPDTWTNPPPEQWVRSTPLGHVLTPVAAMHLFNRLRHHPSSGAFHLSGWCARQEADTLPLLRQISYFVDERVHVEEAEKGGLAGPLVFARLVAIALQLDLPVWEEKIEGQTGARITLSLPETPDVPLSTFRDFPAELLHAYQLDWAAADQVACGLERWCLAIIARYGVNASHWPDLGSLGAV